MQVVITRSLTGSLATQLGTLRGADPKRDRVPTGVLPRTLGGANWGVTQVTTGCQPGRHYRVLLMTRRVNDWSVDELCVVACAGPVTGVVCSHYLCYCSHCCCYFLLSAFHRISPILHLILYRLIDTMVTMVKRWYRLSGTSAIAADKCTNTAHHSVDIDVKLTWIGGHVQSGVRCFKERSAWLDA